VKIPALAPYAVVTAFIGHRYWMLRGPEHFENMISFYKKALPCCWL